MENTDIIKQIDEYGKIGIPKKIRKIMGVNAKDKIEVYVKGNKIIFQKYEPTCVFCGESNNTFDYKGKVICNTCLDIIKSEVI